MHILLCPPVTPVVIHSSFPAVIVCVLNSSVVGLSHKFYFLTLRVQKAIVDEASEPSAPGSFAQTDPKAINKVKKKARKILQEMVANVSPALIR